MKSHLSYLHLYKSAGLLSAVMGGCDCMYSNISTECSFSLTLVCVDLISQAGGYEKLGRHCTTRKQSRTEAVIGDLDICCLAVYSTTATFMGIL